MSKNTSILDNERGAYMVEAAISIPLLLVLVLAIFTALDVVLTRLVVEDSLRLASQSLVRKGDGCSATAETDFTKHIGRLPSNAKISNLRVERPETDLNGNTFGQRFYTVSADVYLQCTICGLVPGMPDNLFDYTATMRTLAENVSDC